MTKRYKYGINCQQHTGANFSYLTPLGYFDVVPGDTISGTARVRYHSDNTKFFVMNRAFFDVYAFYIPYRLLWEDFPQWLIDSTATGLPTVTDVYEWNWERNFLHSATENTAFFRRAYNMINASFFNPGDAVVAPDDTKTVHRVYNRPTTFHEKALTDSESQNSATVASATTMNIDDLRDVLQRQRFDRIRSYYGSKYTDYLRAVGVQGDWGILEEPELIGQSHHDMKAITLTSTAETLTSADAVSEQFGGYITQWRGVTELKLKRTFCPEHGLIAFMGVPKLDCPNEKAMNPSLYKSSDEWFWSPEREAKQNVQWPTGVFDGTASGQTTGDYNTHSFEYLKSGANISTWGAAASNIGMVLDDGGTTVDEYRQAYDGDDMFSGSNDLFQGNFANLAGQAVKAGFVFTTDYRLTRLSPVHPRPENKPMF